MFSRQCCPGRQNFDASYMNDNMNNDYDMNNMNNFDDMNTFAGVEQQPIVEQVQERQVHRTIVHEVPQE